MSETSEKWDGGFEDNIRCPFCGEEDEEHTEYPDLNYDGDTALYWCDRCDKKSTVRLCATYTYATEPAAPSPGSGEGAK